jgi:putative aldouronate transport system permease protein
VAEVQVRPSSAAQSLPERVFGTLRRYWFVYLLMLPGLAWIVVFQYVPIYGLLVAFKDFNIVKGITRSPWVGLENFRVLFQSARFYLALRNTLIINLYSLAFGFTFTVFLALLLNEVRISWYKRTVQTMVYIPHFVSWVVIGALVSRMLYPEPDSPINFLVGLFGVQPRHWLTAPEYFRGIVVIVNTIKEAGFATIIYLAALSTVNPDLVESAHCDGAHRGHLMRHIYLPRIAPTIAVLFILQLSGMFGSNFDLMYNLYNPAVYDVGDVLSTYLYRTGLLQSKFEQATALGLVFNLLGLVLLLSANRGIRRMNVMGIFE